MAEDIEEEQDKSIAKRILDKLKKPLSPPWWFKKFINFVSGGKTDLMPKYYLTDELIKKVYIVHGTKDEYIPFEKSGKLIIEKYNLSKDRYLLVDAGHSFDDQAQITEILEWIHSKL